MKNKILAILAVGLLAGPTAANATLYIDNLNFTATSVSFDLTGTVDIVGCCDFDSLFFGFVGSSTWITSNPVAAGGFSSNGGTYNFTSVGGYDSNVWGDYLFTNGPDTLVVGDVVDLSYIISGTFDLTGLSIWDFKVQAGWDGTSNDFIQAELITGGVTSIVPEPGTLALFGLGLLGLGLSKWRKLN